MPTPQGYIRVLVERPKDDQLVAAAIDVGEGRDPRIAMERYVGAKTLAFEIDKAWGAVAIGVGSGAADVPLKSLHPRNSDWFLVRAYIKAPPAGAAPLTVDGGQVYSDSPITGLLTCGTSRAVGDTDTVRQRLDVGALAKAGFDGRKVAIAIVDTGICLDRLVRRLGDLAPGPTPAHDPANSWTPSNIVTRSFKRRIGHGTMCAYDALIAAPKATLLDLPMLIDRPAGDHFAETTVGSAIRAFSYLALRWDAWQSPGAEPPYDALVISNSWGIFHPSLDPPTGGTQFINDPLHALRRFFVRPMSVAGIDFVFASNNCGVDCQSATCRGLSSGMIMGGNAYPEVLTVGGCDCNDDLVGYSSRGPSISGMYQQKPDVVCYTHFSGSRAIAPSVPDTGVSASSAVAAGCVAALRSGLSPRSISSSALFDAIRATAVAVRGGGPGGAWNAASGYGIVRPCAAARQLGAVI